MAEGGPDRNLYGQFGRAIYDQAVKEWNFERATNQSKVFTTHDGTRVIVPPTAKQSFTSARNIDPNGVGRRLEKQTKALIQAYPELQPASNLLPELARISECVEDAAQLHDPAQGNLIAFGYIIDELTKLPAEIVAFPSGSTGSDLCVARVQRPTKGVDGSNESWTTFGETATWKGPGAPIQSITFAAPIERSNIYLAVRLWTETLIFHPVLMQKPKKSSSRLDPNLIFRLNTRETDALPLAHASFNPWASRQVNIVDEAGHWSVRRIRGRHRWTVDEIAHGSLIDDSNDAKRVPVDDGWARIEGVGASTILTICNRRKMLLFDLDSQESFELQGVTTVLDDGLCWNLDMAIAPGRPEYLLVLTTAHVLVYHIGRDDFQAVESKCVVSVRHFRNPEDVSMRLCVFPDSKDVLILIRSDLTSTIIWYRIIFSDANHITVSDSTELIIPAISGTKGETAYVSGLHIHSIPGAQNDDTAFAGISSTSTISRDSHVYSVITLCKDFSVLETLYSRKPRERAQHTVASASDDLPSKGKKSETHRNSNKGENSSKVFNAPELRKEPASRYVRRRRDQATSRSSADWTMNYQLSCEDLNEVKDSDLTSIDDISKEAHMRLRNPDTGDGRPFPTLRELSEGEITCDNLQEAVASLDDVQSTEDANQGNEVVDDNTELLGKHQPFVLRPIAWPSALKSYYSEGSNRLAVFHQSIVGKWISPLPDDVTEIVRSTKAQHTQRIATEVTLASLVIRPDESLLEQLPQRQSQSQSQGENFEIPVRPSEVPSFSRTTPTPTPSVFSGPSSAPESPLLPTPSRSATPSTTTTHRHSSTTSQGPEISRLSQYTTFSLPAPPSLPRSLTRILSHWVPGTDPENYDWQSISRRFRREGEIEEEEGSQKLSERQRAREQRRAERHARRQIREAERTERMAVLSNQAPAIATATGSQPTQITGGYNFNPSAAVAGGSSQMVHATSQVLPGRHGGRRGPVKKRKRKSGF